MESVDPVRLPAEKVPTVKLPQRVLDLARVIQDVAPPIKWYIHALINGVYYAAILGSFRREEDADEAIRAFVHASGAQSWSRFSTACCSLNYLRADNGSAPQITVCLSTEENPAEIKHVLGLSGVKLTALSFEEFKQAALNPVKKKPAA